MGSESYTTLNAANAVPPYGSLSLIPGETSLNYEDLLAPYPSPPVEPAFTPLLITPESSMRSSSPVSTISGTAGSQNVVVSVSTSFNPTSHSITPDVIFKTSDTVLFYAHYNLLRTLSSGAFNQVLGSQNGTDQTSQHTVPGSEVIHDIPDSSTVFNVILHTLYGTSPAQNLPSFETLLTAVDRMLFYGMDPKDFITKHTPLHHLLLTQAPLHPLQVYALAGHHGLEDLAVSSSSHLLSFPISQLPDEMAVRMGPIYLKRLFCLHFNRVDALKQILLVPPHPHPPTRECDFDAQKSLTRAWALVAAYLAWDARPDLSTSSMKKAFQPLTERLTCGLCLTELENRLKEVVEQWASVIPTI